jgi:hypothetical protein
MKFDPCVFVYSEKSTYLSVHFDDIMLFGDDPKIISNIENVLHTNFECTDRDTAAYILGIKNKYSPQSISLNQHLYINTIPEQFGMSDYHPVCIPIDPGIQLGTGQP